MAENNKPSVPQNRAPGAGAVNLGSTLGNKIATPPPPSETGRGAAPGAQVKQDTFTEGKKKFYFRSSTVSTNLHRPDGGEPIRFRNYSFVTEDPKEAEFVRTSFVGRQAGPLQVKEIDKAEYDERSKPSLSNTMDMGVAVPSQQQRFVNADGEEVVQPVEEPLNMMNYPQPPLNALPPTPGPHVAAEVSTDPADKGGVKPGLPPVATQANPGPAETSTTRPQDQPNVPADEQAPPDEAPAPRPDKK